jgi:hypothetical protein
LSCATSAITTRAPSAAKARTIASPMPWAPPVTMATLFSNFMVRFLKILCGRSADPVDQAERFLPV